MKHEHEEHEGDACGGQAHTGDLALQQGLQRNAEVVPAGGMHAGDGFEFREQRIVDAFGGREGAEGGGAGDEAGER